MAIQRMDHVGIVVSDMAATIAFFAALGLEARGETSVEGEWVERIVGLGDMKVDSAMLGTADGHGRLELIKFHSPPAEDDGAAPPNRVGIRHVAFVVEDIEAVLDTVRKHGGELVGELVDYADTYRLCYVRGPDEIIVELAEPVR